MPAPKKAMNRATSGDRQAAAAAAEKTEADGEADEDEEEGDGDHGASIPVFAPTASRASAASSS
jgi:hypothetical protein